MFLFYYLLVVSLLCFTTANTLYPLNVIVTRCSQYSLYVWFNFQSRNLGKRNPTSLPERGGGGQPKTESHYFNRTYVPQTSVQKGKIMSLRFTVYNKIKSNRVYVIKIYPNTLLFSN